MFSRLDENFAKGTENISSLLYFQKKRLKTVSSQVVAFFREMYKNHQGVPENMRPELSRICEKHFADLLPGFLNVFNGNFKKILCAIL